MPIRRVQLILYCCDVAAATCLLQVKEITFSKYLGIHIKENKRKTYLFPNACEILLTCLKYNCFLATIENKTL